jgi:cAMP-dependent protein kinase regulator
MITYLDNEVSGNKGVELSKEEQAELKHLRSRHKNLKQ